MRRLVHRGEVGLVVKGLRDGQPRGWTYLGGGLYQSDRQAEVTSHDDFFAEDADRNALTFTVVPLGSEIRIGVDRDENGILDRDQLDLEEAVVDPAPRRRATRLRDQGSR